MTVFVVTIVIGILNGLDLVEFTYDQLLTHVHSGTLGWITLALVAASAWYFGGIDRRLAWTLGILVPIYVLAFYIGNTTFRAIAGGALLIAILWLLVWVWGMYSSRRSLPALAIALGLTTFTYGAVIGVLRQVQLAGGPSLFPETADIVGAHASAMVFSYLILVAMGLLEWRLLGTTDLPRAGLVQIGALFIGGFVLSFTLLFLTGDATQAAGGIDLLVDIVATVIFLVRIVPAALRVDWASGPGRHFAAASLFVILAMAIFLYVVFRIINDPALAQDFTPIAGIALASDHSAFIGVITNTVLGLLLVLTADRGDRWPWVDQVAFWGVNGGLLVFVVSLATETRLLERIGAPVMGLSLLVTLAAIAMRLRESRLVTEA